MSKQPSYFEVTISYKMHVYADSKQEAIKMACDAKDIVGAIIDAKEIFGPNSEAYPI